MDKENMEEKTDYKKLYDHALKVIEAQERSLMSYRNRKAKLNIKCSHEKGFCNASCLFEGYKIL